MSPKNANETSAQKAARFREMAKDKSLPQDVRNAYLDKANEVEMKGAKPAPFAKGGAVSKALPKRGERTATNKANKDKAKPAVALMIAVGKPKMAKGGSVGKPPAKKGK